MKNTTFKKLLETVKEQINTPACIWHTDGLTAEEIEELDLSPTEFTLSIPAALVKERIGLAPAELGNHYVRKVLPGLFQKHLYKTRKRTLLFEVWVEDLHGDGELMVVGNTNLPELAGDRLNK